MKLTMSVRTVDSDGYENPRMNTTPWSKELNQINLFHLQRRKELQKTKRRQTI